MGSSGSKPRKPQGHLPKVPKYEEPNSASLPGAANGSGVGSNEGGRFGHGSAHHGPKQPGKAGKFFLKVLGLKPKGQTTG